MKTDLSYYQPALIAPGRLFNTGAGISFRSKNERFYFGASACNFSIQTLKFTNKNERTPYYYTTADFYLMSGLDIPINNKITLTPAINIWSNDIDDINITSNVMLNIMKQFLIGLQYSNDNGWEFGGLRLGYKNKANSLAFHYSYCHDIYDKRIFKSGQHNLGIIYTPKFK